MAKVTIFDNYKKVEVNGISREEAERLIEDVNFYKATKMISDNLSYAFNKIEYQLDLISGNFFTAGYMVGQTDICDCYITIFTIKPSRYEQGDFIKGDILRDLEIDWENINYQLDRHYPDGQIYILEQKPSYPYKTFFKGTFEELVSFLNIDAEKFPSIEDVMMNRYLFGDFRYILVNKYEYEAIEKGELYVR